MPGLNTGEAHDATAYDALMQTDDVRPKALLGDKGYDSDAIREDSWFHGTNPVIPTKSNRKVQRPVDPVLYALRNRIERFFNKLKNARRVATRYDKTADSFMAFIQLASIKIWLRFVNRSKQNQSGQNEEPNNPHSQHHPSAHLTAIHHGLDHRHFSCVFLRLNQ